MIFTSQIITDLAQRVSGLVPKSCRRIIAIAGPPASGKSTLAEQLVVRLGPAAALVPMDGFHLDNRLLEARGLRARKGAPETFDAAGFVHLIRRMTQEAHVVLPVFDRQRDIAISGAAEVSEATQTVVVEGNYLLLDAAPWRDLHTLWDLTVFLKTEETTLTERLIQRWRDNDHSAEQALARIRMNDLPNAQMVLAQSVAADITV